MQTLNGIDVPQTLAEAAAPEMTALVVYDMQVGILSQLKNGPAVLQRVLQLLEHARSAGIRVCFMRHMSLPKKLAGSFQLRQMMAWQRKSAVEDVQPWFLRDSPGFALAPELQVRQDEVIFDKITFSAFEGTPLAITLRDCDRKSFVICGVATEIGIDPTVRHGADLGFIPIVATDACGGGHEHAGKQSLESMQFMGDALLCSVDDLAAIWRQRP